MNNMNSEFREFYPMTSSLYHITNEMKILRLGFIESSALFLRSAFFCQIHVLLKKLLQNKTLSNICFKIPLIIEGYRRTIYFNRLPTFDALVGNLYTFASRCAIYPTKQIDYPTISSIDGR